MFPATPLTELLGIEYPILLAPMAGASTPELTAAVSNAGGLGAFAAAVLSPRRSTQASRAFASFPPSLSA